MTASMVGHRVLITGCRGFVGRSLGRAAHAAGASMLGVSRSASGERDWPGEHVQADVAGDDLRGILKKFGPTIIVHAAGPAAVGASFCKPFNDLKASLLSWGNIADAARVVVPDALLVLISSAAVYGEPQTLPIAEDHPFRPISPYGYHKVMCELVAEEHHRCFGASVLICRLFSLIGPEQRRLLPWELFGQFRNPSSSEVVLQGSTSDARDYLHVDDASSAMLSLASAVRHDDDRDLHRFNVASGVETTVEQVVQAFARRLGAKPIRSLDLDRPGDPNRWRADISALKAALPSWTPRPFEAAVDDCVERWTR